MAEPDRRQWDLDTSFTETNAFIQWKGTDVCMDFRCECGADGHFDGMFAYVVRCPSCGTLWEMPSNVFPRKSQRDPEFGGVVTFEADDEDAALGGEK